MSTKESEVLIIVDAYAELRYPNPSHETEVGSDNLEKIDGLLNRILEQTPEVFYKYFESIEPTRKGGRVLMERRIEKQKDT